MLSYPVAEATTLLESKLSTAQQSLENCEEDLDFLREQITVSFCQHSAETLIADGGPDVGSSDCSSIQLGGHDEAERETGTW